MVAVRYQRRDRVVSSMIDVSPRSIIETLDRARAQLNRIRGFYPRAIAYNYRSHATLRPGVSAVRIDS